MLVRNTRTGEQLDLEGSVAERWHHSCSPWTYGWKSKINPTGYNFSEIEPESMHQFWNNNMAFVRSALIARQLSASIKELGVTNIIWTQLINSSYTTAVIEWCKAYGTNNEEFHWKKVFGENSSFITDLSWELNLTKDDLERYRVAMTEARSKRIAHSNMDGEAEIKLPQFDTAINMARATHALVIELIPRIPTEPNEIYRLNPPNFESWITHLQDSISSTIPDALAATKNVVFER
ncbi:hypothetical protein HP15_3111 [Marinobacter adhaerens HP15]|uniref:HEPN AbiU2-like domain-containing protein n=2 Tax=Marinobacter adhaerens TaxID=1033846 RepID=E4PPK4_MARAH|nr:hypothetical protein HP15_3111 [Marinobacter adhaerens HP15]